MHFCSVPPVWERINKLLGTALQAKKKQGQNPTEREQNGPWIVSCSNTERGEHWEIYKILSE